MNKIFAVQTSNSYGDFGDWRIHSYHKSEEGAYIKLDELAKEEGLTGYKFETRYGYYYSNDGRELSVEDIKLEDWRWVNVKKLRAV